MIEGRAHRKGRPSPVTAQEIERWREMRETKNLSYPEIEEATGVAADTVRYHLSRKNRKGSQESQPQKGA